MLADNILAVLMFRTDHVLFLKLEVRDQEDISTALIPFVVGVSELRTQRPLILLLTAFLSN